MSKTSGNCPNPVNNCVYYTHQAHEIYQVLPYSVDFKAPGSFKIRRSFIWNEGVVNIWNDREAQK